MGVAPGNLARLADAGLAVLLTAGDLCDLFGYKHSSWTAFLKPRLEAAGFPPPAVGGANSRSARWDPAAVRAWLDQAGGLAKLRGDHEHGGDPEADEQARIDALLDQRTAAMGGR